MANSAKVISDYAKERGIGYWDAVKELEEKAREERRRQPYDIRTPDQRKRDAAMLVASMGYLLNYTGGPYGRRRR